MYDQGTALAFGRFRFDPNTHVLQRDGQPVELGSRALEVLSALIEARGGLVHKGTLMDRVWPNIVVEENNLQVQVSALRKVLGDERDLIRTVPGRGYQFTGQVRPRPASDHAPGRPDDWAAGVSESRQRLSIVVLPFINISDDLGSTI